MEGDIPRRTSERLCKVFRQHVFARRLAADKQQIFPAQQCGDGGLPDLLAVIAIVRLRNSVLQCRFRGILCTISADAVEQLTADLFLL